MKLFPEPELPPLEEIARRLQYLEGRIDGLTISPFGVRATASLSINSKGELSVAVGVGSSWRVIGFVEGFLASFPYEDVFVEEGN